MPAARLAELRDAALLDRIEADLALGAAGPVLIGELRELTAADRLAERPAGLLMRALAATGRQAEALAVYQRTRELLADSLGVDPSQQLDQAYLAVLRHEVSPATGGAAVVRRMHPPPPPTPFPHAVAAPGTSRTASSAGSADVASAVLKQLAGRAPGHADRAGRRGQDPAGGGGGRATGRLRVVHRFGLVRRAGPGGGAVRAALRGTRRARPARTLARQARPGRGGRPPRPAVRRAGRPGRGADPRQLRAPDRGRRRAGGPPAGRLPRCARPRDQPRAARDRRRDAVPGRPAPGPARRPPGRSRARDGPG